MATPTEKGKTLEDKKSTFSTAANNIQLGKIILHISFVMSALVKPYTNTCTGNLSRLSMHAVEPR